MNQFSSLPEEMIINILFQIILTKSKTFGKKSINRIIKDILRLVCKEWNFIILNNSNFYQINDICSDKLFSKYLHTNDKSQDFNCNNYIYCDCVGFSKLNIDWKIDKSDCYLGKKSDIMIINNFTFIDKQQDHDLNYEIIRWIGCVNNLNHINICQILNFSINSNILQIVFEPTHISLNYLLYNNFKHTSQFTFQKIDAILIKSIMYQLLSALNYCHSLNICHGNLSPHRILFQILPEGLLLKLVDFKHSPSLVTTQDLKNQPIMPSYRSPELQNKFIYSSKNDIWAAGNMMFLMVNCQYERLINHDDLSLKNMINQLNLENCCKNLLIGLLHINHQKRYSAQRALKQPYFNKINNQCKIIKKYYKSINKNFKSPLDIDNYTKIGWLNNNKSFILPDNSLFRQRYLTYINSGCWQILIDWLIEVSFSFHLHPDVLNTACQYLYVYLSYVNVHRKNFQLVGCCALYLSSVWIENLISPLGDYIYISDKAFTIEDMNSTIMDMIIKLQGNFYDLSFRDCMSLYIQQSYNQKLVNWIYLLGNISQINYYLILMPKKLVYLNLIFIMDLINEILTGISNSELRIKIFSIPEFKKSHFEFIPLFYDLFKKINPHNNIIHTNINKIKFIYGKKIANYREILDNKEMIKLLSTNKIKNKQSTIIIKKLLYFDTDYDNVNLVLNNDLDKGKNSVYLFTKSLLSWKCKEITYFPENDSYKYLMSFKPESKE